MIFTDKKLTDEILDIRTYAWSDPYKGWGDAGTLGYFKIPLKYFEEEEKERMIPKGEVYFTYKLDQEKTVEIFGEGYWMEMNYELVDEVKKQKEIELHQKILAASLTPTVIIK